MRLANHKKMQYNKQNRGRTDRREDARRSNREQENATAYRPRTRRRAGEQNLEKESTREARENTRYRQNSGSYRPRTAKKTFIPRRHEEEERDIFIDNDNAVESTERNNDFRSEQSQQSRGNRQRDRKKPIRQRLAYEKESNRSERKEKRSNRIERREEGRILDHHSDKNNAFGHTGSRGNAENNFLGRRDREQDEHSERHNVRRAKSQRRRGSESFLERGKKTEGTQRRKERETRYGQNFQKRIGAGEEVRERRKRSEERIGSAAPIGRMGRHLTSQREEYFQGLDSELAGRTVRRGFRGEKKFRGRKNESWSAVRESKRKEQEEPIVHAPLDLNLPMRLNRYIAHCGQCSRRDADEMITRGEIAVNGAVVTTLGEKVIPANDIVTHNGEVLKLEQKVYILLNKPKDTFCTVEDEHAERTVLDLVKDACSERIYPVGRLDRNTTGLLLLTNDGDLTEKLTHPSYAKRKTYEVTLDRKVTPQDMEQLRSGIALEDGTFVQVDEIAYVRPDDNCTVGVTIHTGQNRVVRRMFDALGFRVERLDRVLYAGLTKRNLPRGTWRFLTDDEIRMLKNDNYR